MKWGSLLGEPQYDPFPGARSPEIPDPALYYARGVRVRPPAQPDRPGVDGAARRPGDELHPAPLAHSLLWHAWCEARGRAPNAQDGHSGRLTRSFSNNEREVNFCNPPWKGPRAVGAAAVGDASAQQQWWWFALALTAVADTPPSGFFWTPRAQFSL